MCLLGTRPGVETAAMVHALHGAGFAVLERSANQNAIALALSGEFDLVCWVCPAPDAGVLSALSSIADGGLPLIALLPEPTAVMISEALIGGADACLALNADAMVVRAQAEALLRRRTRAGVIRPVGGSPVLQVGDITVDVDRCEVSRAGELIPLTAQEFRVVEYMVRNAGHVLPAQEILNAVSDGYVYTNREAQDIFKATVRRIRRKLEPVEAEPTYLVTVRGFGYRFEGNSPVRIGATA